MVLTPKQKEIIKIYTGLVRKSGKYPTRAALLSAGVSRDKVRDHFGNMNALKEAAIQEKPKSFAKLEGKRRLIEEHPFKNFTKEALGSIVKENNFEDGIFFITAAAPCSYIDLDDKEKEKILDGKPVIAENLHIPAFNAVKNFLKRQKAELIILPMPAHVRALKEQPQHYDPNLFPHLKDFVTEYTFNSHLKAIEAHINPQQINPLTGMRRLKIHKLREGGHLGEEIKRHKTSLVIGHSKQMMEVVATGNDSHPRIIHSTGAITRPAYLKNRIGLIAESDHTLGGLIIEIEGGIFYLRQVQMDPRDGSFVDIGTRYFADGSVKEERAEAFKMGDIHPGLQDPAVLDCWYDLWDTIKPKRIFYEDFFDGKSISHHLEKKNLERVQRPEHFRTLPNEIEMAKIVLNDTFDHAPNDAELIATASNHPEHLMRYLNEARYINDIDVNFDIAHRMVVMKLDGKNPLKEYLDPEERMNWTSRNEDYFVEGVQMNSHGDQGTNGSRAGKTGQEATYSDAMVAHSHTPGIYHQLFTVGHSTVPRHGYNDGPSTWIPCSGAVYKRGQKQLYMVINGKYRRDTKKD